MSVWKRWGSTTLTEVCGKPNERQQMLSGVRVLLRVARAGAGACFRMHEGG